MPTHVRRDHIRSLHCHSSGCCPGLVLHEGSHLNGRHGGRYIMRTWTTRRFGDMGIRWMHPWKTKAVRLREIWSIRHRRTSIDGGQQRTTGEGTDDSMVEHVYVVCKYMTTSFAIQTETSTNTQREPRVHPCFAELIYDLQSGSVVRCSLGYFVKDNSRVLSDKTKGRRSLTATHLEPIQYSSNFLNVQLVYTRVIFSSASKTTFGSRDLQRRSPIRQAPPNFAIGETHFHFLIYICTSKPKTRKPTSNKALKATYLMVKQKSNHSTEEISSTNK